MAQQRPLASLRNKSVPLLFILFSRELLTKHGFQCFEYLVIVTHIQNEDFPFLVKMRRANPMDLRCPHCAAIE